MSVSVTQHIVYLDGTISLNKREEKQIIINDLKLANTLDLTVERKEITRCYVKIPDFTKATQQIQKLKNLAINNPGPAVIILVNDLRQTWQFHSPYTISYSQRVQNEVKDIFGNERVVFK